MVEVLVGQSGMPRVGTEKSAVGMHSRSRDIANVSRLPGMILEY